MLTALKVLGFALNVLFVLARIALLRCTFLTWITALWMYVSSPGLQALVKASPVVEIVSVALSAVVGIRSLCWLIHVTSATHWVHQSHATRPY